MNIEGVINEFIRQAVMYIVPSVSAFIIAVIIKKLKDWKLKTKYRSIADIIDIIDTIINSLYQEFIEDIKNDGRFTKEEQKKFKEKAILLIKQTLDGKKKKILKDMFKDLGNLDTIIGAIIENVIYKKKRNIPLFEFKYRF